MTTRNGGGAASAAVHRRAGRRLSKFLPLVSLIVFAAGVWVLHRELAGHDIAEIVRGILRHPPGQIALALCLAAASYTLLMGYDWLALRHLGKKLPLSRVASISFISVAVGLNLGAAVLTGGSLRLRMYAAAGLSAIEIGIIVAFLLLATLLGLGTLTGVALLVEPPAVFTAAGMPLWAARAIGGVLLAAVAGYLVLAFLRRRPVRIFGYEVRIPSIRISLAQLLVSAADISFAASVLFVLLPAQADLSFIAFLGLFVIAAAVGTLSNVPGGIGVFEAIIVVMLPNVPTDALLSAMLTYRVIYYFLPLILAGGLLSGLELRSATISSSRLTSTLLAARFVAPQVLGTLTFLSGFLLLLSGATPAVATRIAFLRDVLPLSLLEVSHLLASAVGFALLILGRGLYRRLNAAWWLSIAALAAGVALSLVKGFDYEEAGILALILLLLLPARRAFYRQASLMSPSLTPGWLVAITTAVLGSVWVGAASFRQVPLTEKLLVDFAFTGDAPRFLRASLVVAALAGCFALWRLMSGRAPRLETLDAASEEIARQIVAASPDPDAKLALTGDKRFVFSDTGRSMIMFGVVGRSWISMGDPIGPKEEWEALVWRFREISDRHDGRIVFYQVNEENLGLYADIGLTLLKIGEDAVVSLTDFTMQGGGRAKLRQAMKRVGRDGGTFEVVMPPHSAPLLAGLRVISNQWLGDKNTAEKGFSVGRFDEKYLADQPIALVKVGGRTVAFANVWAGPPSGEFSVDLMRHTEDAPDGIMDFLFGSLMLWGQEQGYTAFSLGMAPLSGLAKHPLAPTWQRLGAAIYRYGEYFYNFEGLRHYKEKFDPVWRPKYIAVPPGLGLPQILLDIARLISGGVKGLLIR
ncbi:MAG: bifunctional lysylphosphatidylglycerol flippase/synthetase MprF [Alphaproteobacteria bacterium]|nr:bifunctional lysylphosphatidylglycerol flippase/synthetase MprF [Alphaproteobacteria bacterium]